MNMIKLKQSILAIIIGLALSAGISYAASWVGPTANPPLNNTDAPVNVGTKDQWKSAGLGADRLSSGDWISWNSGKSSLTSDQGGSIELGDGKTQGATPYIDFHYGTGSSQDYNARLINLRDGTLVAKFPNSGGSFVIEGNGSKDSRLTIGDGQPTVWSWANGWATAGDLSLIEENVAGDRIYVKPGGNVGIGTSNPQMKLDVNGDEYINGFVRGATYGFGGMFTQGGGQCFYGNPFVDGSCSCPSGFTQIILALGVKSSMGPLFDEFYCAK